jgi:serine/threonine-protein kinase HipA
MARLRPDRLAVWLGDQHVADLHEPRARQIRLVYTSGAVDRFGAGGLALSASLPVRAAPYGARETEPYLEGLLPEGEARTRIERTFGVPRGDTFRLLAAVGGDCAGAVSILDSGGPPVADLAAAEGIDDGMVAEEIADLAEHPLGAGADVRLSLAGLQDKLLLCQLPDGRWARPRGGAPSTHILKPEPPRFPGLVALEAYGLRLAAAAGLAAATAEVHRWGERPVLVVARYDRVVASDGTVRRVHQEDMCQALARSAEQKYESEGGPRFAEIAEVVRRLSTSPREDLLRLAGALALTVAVGNADAHGRNLSLLYDFPVRRLAPLYDVVPTFAIRPRAGEPPLTTELAMTVNGISEQDAVTGADLLAETATWRVPPSSAEPAVRVVLETLVSNAPAVAEHLAASDPALLANAADLVASRAERLLRDL